MIASAGANGRRHARGGSSPRGAGSSPRGPVSRLQLPGRQSHARSRTSPNAVVPESNVRVEVMSGDLAKLFDEIGAMKMQLHHLRSGQQELYKALDDLPAVRRNRLRNKRMSETPLGVLAKKRREEERRRVTPRGFHVPRVSGGTTGGLPFVQFPPTGASSKPAKGNSNPFASLPLQPPSREGSPSRDSNSPKGQKSDDSGSEGSGKNEGADGYPKHRGHTATTVELATLPPTVSPTPNRRDSASEMPGNPPNGGQQDTSGLLESYVYGQQAINPEEESRLSSRLSYLGHVNSNKDGDGVKMLGDGDEPLQRAETDNFRNMLTAAKSRKQHESHAPYGVSSKDEFLASLSCWKRYRQKGYFIFHDENYSTLAFVVLMSVLALIFISTLAYVLETIEDLSGYTDVWYCIELVVTSLFTLEYVTRLLIVKRRLRYMIMPMNVIDLLAILPFYMELLFPDMPTQTLRVLRVIRLARIARLRNLFSEYIEIMTSALKNAMDEAGPMMGLMLIVETVLFGSVVYAFENGNHTGSDGAQTGFTSIPDTMWWAFVTITTVGYGDMSPVTPVGRFFGILCMFSGIVLMSIVVIIIGGNFEQAHSQYVDEKQSFKDLASGGVDADELEYPPGGGSPGAKEEDKDSSRE